MRHRTRCPFCWQAIPPRRNPRLYCDPCGGKFRRLQSSDAERDHAWYVANRQNNPVWREENKRRAKAFRERRKAQAEMHA